MSAEKKAFTGAFVVGILIGFPIGMATSWLIVYLRTKEIEANNKPDSTR